MTLAVHVIGVVTAIPTGITHPCPRRWAWQLCHQEMTLGSGGPGLTHRARKGKLTELGKFWPIITHETVQRVNGALVTDINTKTQTDLITSI